MKGIPTGARLAFCVIVGAALAACGASAVTTPYSVPQHPPSNSSRVTVDAANLFSNARLTAQDKGILLGIFRAGHIHSPYGTRNVKNTIIAVVIADSHGHFVRELENRPDIKVRIENEAAEHGPRPLTSPTPVTGTGPYHQLQSINSPVTPLNFADISLPCSGYVVPGPSYEQPYVYLGGWNSTGGSNSEVEAGEQAVISTSNNPLSPTTITYKPYERLNNGTFYSVTSQNGSGYNYPPVTTGAGAGGRWYCTSTSPISLFQSFEYAPSPTTGNPTIWGSCFLNTSYEVSSEIFFAVCNGTYPDRYYGWEGWYLDFIGQCSTCTLDQTTSLAQNGGDHKGNGAFYGPVAWSDMQIGGAGEYYNTYTYCINYPVWGGGSQCGNTPPSPLNSVIIVTGQDLSAPAAETVTINNAPGNWTH